VRELRNVIERATIVAKGDLIETGDLPALAGVSAAPAAAAAGPARGLRPGTTVDEAERQLIEVTLDHTGGNKTRAAEMLGISLKTLHNKLNRMKQEEAGEG
jgi:DNA-binding NtrC family response regulator